MALQIREARECDAFASTATWFSFVIEDEAGELIGFAKGTPHDGGVPSFAGELNKIYVSRCLHRQGLGRLLLCNVARRFLERGVTSMLLFGDATNPSNGFYEAFGAESLSATPANSTEDMAGATSTFSSLDVEA